MPLPLPPIAFVLIMAVASAPFPSIAQSTPAAAAIVGLMQSPGWIQARRDSLRGNVDVYIETDSSPASRGIDTSVLSRRVFNYTQLVNGAAKGCGINVRFPGTKSPVPSRVVIFGELPNGTGGAILAAMLPAVQMVAGVSATINTNVLENATKQIRDNGMSLTTLTNAASPNTTIALWDVNRLDDLHRDAFIDLGVFSGLTGMSPSYPPLPGSGAPFSYFTGAEDFSGIAGDSQSHSSNVCGAMVVLKTICGDRLPESIADWDQSMSIGAAACLPDAAITQQFESLDSDTAAGK